MEHTHCSTIARREFLRRSALFGAAAVAGGSLGAAENPLIRLAVPTQAEKMRLGLVTYLWGKDWKLDKLIGNCEASEVLGVELRTTHAHGVEPNLSKEERAEVKKRFADTPVELVGLGSNEAFHHTDAKQLKKAIEATKAFIVLSHDVGGSGVKVKPDALPAGVPEEKTIAQIATALRRLGNFAKDYNQEVRVEVHGRDTSKLPIMRRIMRETRHPNVRVCWNSNDVDLEGEGLMHNFDLVDEYFGHTAHVRELNIGSYPYQELMNLFVAIDYKGWVLLEARTTPEDPVAALKEQRETFESMVKTARGVVAGVQEDRPRVRIEYK